MASIAHHYARTIGYNGLLFGLAEKAFLDEIKRIDRRMRRLIAERSADIRKLNAELALKTPDWKEIGTQPALTANMTTAD